MFLRCAVSILLISLCSLLSAAEPTKAAASTTTPPRYLKAVAHFDDRVAQFQRENVSRRAVVLLGDSITEGFDVARWFPGHTVLNRGIGSDTIGVSTDPGDRRGVLHRLDASVFDCCTTHVFLMIGINDFGDSHTVTQMADGYDRILKQIHDREPKIKVHVQSVLPTTGRFAWLNKDVLAFNDRLKELARKYDYPYVDLHPLLRDDSGCLKAEVTRDGLHLNEAGYTIWKREIDRIMGW